MLSLAVFIDKRTSLFQISITEKGFNYLDLVSAFQNCFSLSPITHKVKLERLSIMSLIFVGMVGAYLSAATESDKVMTFAELLDQAAFICKHASLF